MSVAGEVCEGPAISAHLVVLLEKLKSRELLNVATKAQVREMKKWENMLLQLLHLLENIDENIDEQEIQLTSDLVMLTNLAYDVEDFLDELSAECLSRKVNNRARHSAKRSLIRKLTSACFTQEMSDQKKTQQMSANQDITFLLKYTTEALQNLGENLRRTSPSTRSTIMFPVRPPRSLDITSQKIYGRDDIKNKIIQLLLKEDKAGGDKLGVIPIIGRSGIGKTTVARLVYRDKLVLDNFQVRAWVTMTDTSDIMTITKRILEQITRQSSDGKELNAVQLELNQALSGKNFLIVLDDVWMESFVDWADWHTLCIPLMDGAPRSKIIITKRTRIFAGVMGTVAPVELELLSFGDCWSLFADFAFESTSIPPELERIGRQIVGKCKGFPLAARALGGLLCGQKENKWEEVLNSEVWNDAAEIFPALKLCYYVLPSILKRCFLYCTIFPKDYDFEKKQIILLWMAEGLIPPSDDGSNAEELGGKIFDELVARSFFQDFSSDGTRFIMHNLVYELAQQIVGDICVRFEDKDYADKQYDSARYSSYIQDDLDGFKRLESFHKMVRLRSFLPFSGRRYDVCYLASYFPNELLERHRYLRVLSFSRCNITELPSSVGKLKHLRYLDLSYTPIEVLPDSTTSLYNLQTLILEECENLRNLPAGMDKLVNLVHLNIRGAHLIEGMPLELKHLKGLQMLSNFVVGKGRFSMATLGNLNSLRGEICISNLNYVKKASDASHAQLMEKTSIRDLELTWNTDSYMQDGEMQHEVLDKLQPHSHLKKLTVSDYAGSKFPSWLQNLNNLVELRLEGCDRCTSLPQLGTLPNLKNLFIIKMSNLQKIDQQFYGSSCFNPFPSLEVLCFRFMDAWNMWYDIRLGFEKLRELCIGNCGKLSGNLPAHLPSLEVLVVNDCENLMVSLSSVQMLSALEIRNCKGVDFMLKDDFGSLNTIVLSDISTILNLAEGFRRRLNNFKNLTISCESNFTMTVPSSLRQYGSVVTDLECVLQKLPSTDSEQLQMELESSEIEVVTLREFMTLPVWLQKLKFLRELIVERCQLTSPGDLPSMLKVLSVIDCNVYGAFSDLVFRNRQSLQELELYGCDFLISFGRGKLSPTLKKLSIVDCKNLKSLFEKDEYGSFSTSNDLEDLFISGCDNLTSISYLPVGHLRSKLRPRLEISNCKKLESIVKRFYGNVTLELMYICNCENLKSLPEGFHSLANLQEFEISGCPHILSFPEEKWPTSLKTLEIRDLENLKALPDYLHTLSSLRELHISNCKSLVSFPDQGLPPNLKTFSIKNLGKFEWRLDQLGSLLKLDIEEGCTEVELFPPDETQVKLPSRLTHLAIRNFPNTERFSTKFQDLTNLKSLTLCNCPKLASLPEDSQLDNLSELDIRSCPVLEKKLQGGQEQLLWSKICKIPKFEISDA